MPRLSADTVSQLLREMNDFVSDYGTLKPTNTSLPTIIQGTAFFPGGSGLWRGREPFGALPEYFPEDSLMVVAHNFDKESSYLKSIVRGREELHGFWDRLIAYLDAARLEPQQCFFTNALMGLQPAKATGSMDASPFFREQCRSFMNRQIEIIRPRRIAILGNDAAEEMAHSITGIKADVLLHPSALTYKKGDLRAGIIAEQGSKLKRLWS